MLRKLLMTAGVGALVAMAIGVVATCVGLVVSYYADLAPGGAIVLVAAGSFPATLLVSWLLARRPGSAG